MVILPDTDLSKEPIRTPGHRMMVNYLRGLAEEPVFLKKVLDLRGRYNIPPKGLRRVFEKNKQGKRQEKGFRAPDGFRKELDLLAKEYEVREPFEDYLEEFVVHNDLDFEFSYGHREIVDIKKILLGPHRCQSEAAILLNDLKEVTESNPIAILIHPYAGQREILAYIRATYESNIKPLLQQYKDPRIKIGKMRRRNPMVKNRNVFILKNKGKSSKELVGLVYKKFGVLMDAGNIQKILAAERRKLSVNG